MTATSEHITITHQDLVILVKWMRDEFYGMDTIFDAIEKPWNWLEELHQAKLDLLKATS